ncbi:ankyrin repeat-containing domain protein [Phycomyces nitens]|nr:ankyrin repeat-containing domain protein [Phycomyces nitens]
MKQSKKTTRRSTEIVSGLGVRSSTRRTAGTISTRNSSTGIVSSDSSTQKTSISISRVSKVKVTKANNKLKGAVKPVGETFYLVHRTGQPDSENSWEPLTSIDEPTVLAAFHTKLEESSGYSMDVENTGSNVRPLRTSKIRAMVNMKNTMKDSTEEDTESKPPSKRSKTTTEKKVRASVTKKSVMKEIEARKQRQDRKEARADLVNSLDDIIDSTDHTKDCCTRCSITAYREAVKNNDLKALEKIVAAKDTIPHWGDEDFALRGESVMAMAVLNGHTDIVNMLKNDSNENRVSVPAKYMSYQENTGYLRKSTFGHAVRQVSESRGNRQGDAAFFRESDHIPLEVDFVKHLRYSSHGIEILPCFHNSVLMMKKETIHSLELACTRLWSDKGIYMLVASGNYKAAGNLLKEHYDPAHYNHLHTDVLLCTNLQALKSYRRPQIIKKMVNNCGLTPFQCAAINPSSKYLQEFYEALEVFEKFGVDDFGRTVAHFAAASTTPACIEYLISVQYEISAGDKTRLTPLLQAARYGRHKNIKPILEHISNNSLPSADFANHSLLASKRRPLHYAAYYGHHETCRALIECGATVDVVESVTKCTPLLYAAERGHLECVRVLTENGANIEAGNKFSKTALHLASSNGHYEVVKFLLQEGADANMPDTSLNRPVHYAAAFGNLSILKLLVTYGGANPTLENTWRRSPCSVANFKGHLSVVKHLLSRTDFPVSVDFKDEDGLTMLHHCVSETFENKVEIMQSSRTAEILFSKGSNVNIKTMEGDTVLHTLVSSGHFNNYRPLQWVKDSIPPLPSWQIAKPLKFDDNEGLKYQQILAERIIQAGADLDITNDFNETPFGTALFSNNHNMVKILIKNGAKYWRDTDRNGDNLFHYLLRTASFIDRLITHNEEDKIRKKRFTTALNDIWKVLVRTKPTPEMLKEMIETPNNNGYTAFLSGIRFAVKTQKKKIAKEKKRVKNLLAPSFNSLFGFSKPLETEDLTKKDIVLMFDFSTWLNTIKKILPVTNLDPNSTVQLPKDFKKNNPKAKITDYPKETGYGALHFASTTQHKELVEFLLKSGCDVNQRVKIEDTLGETSLSMGFFVKKDKQDYLPDTTLQTIEHSKKKFDIKLPDFDTLLSSFVEVYVENGVNPCIPEKDGLTVLMKAAKTLDGSVISTLCRASAVTSDIIDHKDDSGKTALMYALDSISGKIFWTDHMFSVSPFTKILSSGANINATYPNKETILMKIIRIGNVNLFGSVIQNSQHSINWDIENNDKETALHIAFKGSINEIIRQCIEYVLPFMERNPGSASALDNQGNSPLKLAARSGNEHAVEAMLKCEVNVNVPSGQNSPLIEAIKNRHLKITKYLLDYGAEANQEDELGNYPLHYAVDTEKHHLVQYLLNYGANVMATNKRGQTALHLAIEKTKIQTNASFKIETMLIKAGADINAKDILGRTPLHIAFAGLNVIPNMKEAVLISKKVQQIIKEKDYENKKRFTLDEFVSKYGNNDPQVNEWLEKGKDMAINQENSKNEKTKDDFELTEEEKTALEMYIGYFWERDIGACLRSDPIDIIKFICTIEQTEYDIPDVFGRTPLHYAACTGSFSCTSLLLKKNINVNAEDNDKNGPLQLALGYGHIDYSSMLCNEGADTSKDMVLPDTESVSTFHYSLSKAIMNMTYIIMDRGVKILEFLRDALVTGKFHLAEVLLRSADDETILKSVTADNKNLWHIITDFRPFDTDTWSEYYPELLNRINALNITTSIDSYGCTPAHYAAKHGQLALLKILIDLKLCPIGMLDKNGVSELWYAVSSNETECVEALLETGASVAHVTTEEIKSIVLIATEYKNTKVLKLLLDAGAPTNADRGFKRRDAVSEACFTHNTDNLQLLIEARADLDHPSAVYIGDSLTEYTESTPLFTASHSANPDLFEMLLKAGADPNAFHRTFKAEGNHVTTLFIYLSDRNKTKQLHTLLNYNVDLNAKAPGSSRSIFYTYFFEKRQLKDEDHTIYEHMLHYSSVDINTIDEETGETPLEAAIRENDPILVERLLEVHADPNIESCKKNLGKTSDIYEDKVNAVFHAVLQNRMSILLVICEKTTVPINWFARDNQGRTVVARLITGSQGYYYDNIHILTYISRSVGSRFRELAMTVDNQGRSSISHARSRFSKDAYNKLIKSGVDPDSEDDITETEDMMEITDFIPSQTIEQDADAERAILQARVNALKEDVVMEDKKPIEVDPHSNLGNIGYVVCDDDDEPYDIMVMKIEIFSNNYSRNMFYKMSIIYNKLIDVYILWTRWGAFGETGMHQKTPFLTKEQVVMEFKALFRAKTGNLWDDKESNFVSKPGRYMLIPAKRDKEDVILEEFDFRQSSVESSLHNSLRNTMQLFCNFDFLQVAYKRATIDIPIGQVPQKTIDDALDILNQIQKVQTDFEEKRKTLAAYEQHTARKLINHELVKLSSSYYRLLPRNNTENKSIEPMLREGQLHFEMARQSDLSYLNFAANLILAAKHHISETHPIDYVYQTLGCSLSEVSKDGPTANEYTVIRKYMKSTAKHNNYEIAHLFSASRFGEQERFKPFENNENRKLLWHGSNISNFMGILKQGLRCRPRIAEQHGAQYGHGLYFGDMFSKAISYASNGDGFDNKAYKLLLLCEVALGKECEMGHYRLDEYSEAKGHMSIKALGKEQPDPANAVYDKNGLQIPLGPIMQTKSKSYTYLDYNEYIVRNEAQVKIRYLVLVRESSYCSLCQSSVGKTSIKPLDEYKLKTYGLTDFNEYERQLLQVYLTLNNLNPKQLFDEELAEYIAEKRYLKTWKTPMDLTCRSKVCRNCAHGITSNILADNIRSKSSNLPGGIHKNPQCKYGVKCIQQHTLEHTKTYQHWREQMVDVPSS